MHGHTHSLAVFKPLEHNHCAEQFSHLLLLRFGSIPLSPVCSAFGLGSWLSEQSQETQHTHTQNGMAYRQLWCKLDLQQHLHSNIHYLLSNGLANNLTTAALDKYM